MKHALKMLFQCDFKISFCCLTEVCLVSHSEINKPEWEQKNIDKAIG